LKRIGDFVVADMDLPGSNEESAGENRNPIYDSDTANQATMLSLELNDRLDEHLMRRGIAVPNRGHEEEYESYKELHEASMLNSSKYRDQHKTSLLDPWLNMGKQKLDRLTEQANQMVNAGKSALESWTNMSKLNESLVGGASSLIDRLMWGNLFRPNIQSTVNDVSQKLSSVSSGNVINQLTRKGWSHEDRTSPSRPGQLNQNLSQSSNSVLGNRKYTGNPPGGNIFGPKTE
jgi:hypothetical protein